MTTEMTYYRAGLAQVHDRGFKFHSDRCAPGILELLAPVHGRDGVVLELACGGGTLTSYLIDAGHRVVASDGSPSMVDIARAALPGADVRKIVLPEDELPACDAVVAIGNLLNFLPGGDATERSLAAVARALRPGGVFAIDLVDRSFGTDPVNLRPLARVHPTWAVFSTSVLERPDLLIRELTTFVREPDGRWARDDERHEVQLIDGDWLVARLAEHGISAEVRPSFGEERMRTGMVAVVGRREG